MQDHSRVVLTERRASLGFSAIMQRIGIISFGILLIFAFTNFFIVALGWLIVIGCAGLTVYEIFLFPRQQGARIEITPDRISLGERSFAADAITGIDYKKEAKSWDGNPLHVLSIRGNDGAPDMLVTLNLYVSGAEQADAVAEYVQALADGEGVAAMKQRLQRLANMKVANVGAAPQE